MQLKRLSEELPESYRYAIFIFNPYAYDKTETDIIQGFLEIEQDKYVIMAIHMWNRSENDKIIHATFDFLKVPEEQKQDIYWIYLEDLKKLWSEDVCKTK